MATINFSAGVRSALTTRGAKMEESHSAFSRYGNNLLGKIFFEYLEGNKGPEYKRRANGFITNALSVDTLSKAFDALHDQFHFPITCHKNEKSLGLLPGVKAKIVRALAAVLYAEEQMDAFNQLLKEIIDHTALHVDSVSVLVDLLERRGERSLDTLITYERIGGPDHAPEYKGVLEYEGRIELTGGSKKKLRRMLCDRWLTLHPEIKTLS